MRSERPHENAQHGVDTNSAGFKHAAKHDASNLMVPGKSIDIIVKNGAELK